LIGQPRFYGQLLRALEISVWMAVPMLLGMSVPTGGAKQVRAAAWRRFVMRVRLQRARHASAGQAVGTQPGHRCLGRTLDQFAAASVVIRRDI